LVILGTGVVASGAEKSISSPPDSALNAEPCGCESVAAGCGAACESGCGCNWLACNADPRWTVSAGTVILHRSTARPAVLVIDAQTDQQLEDVGDFNLGFAAGPEIELTRHFENGWDIGIRYFSIDGWDTTHSLNILGNLQVPLVSVDLDDLFDDVSASYASRLYNAEINLKRQLTDRLRILAGFRMVELDEIISARAYSQDLEGSFGVQARNYLYGFQLGSEATLLRRGPFQVDGFLKAGIYGTHINAGAQGEGTNFELDEGIAHRQTSFLGELGVTGSYQLGKHLAVYGGYELMWIDHIALAADSVAAIERLDGNTFLSGTAFYHGATAGLTLSW